MELQAESRPVVCFICGYAHVVGAGNKAEVIGQAGNAVGMRHPHLRLQLNAMKQQFILFHEREVGTPIFAGRRSLHLSTVFLGKQLRSIANPQQGNLPVELRKSYARRTGIAHAERAARKNDAFDVSQIFGNMMIGMNLTIDIQLPYTPGNQLGILRAKIEDKDGLLHMQR